MRMLVTTENQGVIFYLKGTTWAFNSDRADKFETLEQAKSAVEKARKFMHTKIYKAIKYKEM